MGGVSLFDEGSEEACADGGAIAGQVMGKRDGP